MHQTEMLTGKEQIQQLALLYARGVNQKDFALLRSLYTHDATDNHGEHFQGTAADYLDWLEEIMNASIYCRHHVANHLIAVDGEIAEGEVYTIACNLFPDGSGGHLDNMKVFRFLDRYRQADGRWRFSHREVVFDADITRPATHSNSATMAAGTAFSPLSHGLFQRGPRDRASEARPN